MREEDTVCVGSDGLRYCKVCGEAKEAFFPEGGFMGMKKHSRQCACDRKAYEEEQKYFKEKEHRELVSRNTSICFDESRMEEWTFENADMSDAVMHKAKSYVDNWEEMKRNHIGCLFWGPVGTGKSYIAGCIANELLKREVTVKMTNFNTIMFLFRQNRLEVLFCPEWKRMSRKFMKRSIPTEEIYRHIKLRLS